MDASIAHAVAGRIFPKAASSSRNRWRDGARRERTFADALEVRPPDVAPSNELASRAATESDDEADGIGREIDVTA